jgi:4-aminobutyrate aminotransferase-like enzyme
LVIIDEVQTGLGRLGDYTWGFELHDIVPDIITSGKPLGNGHPLAVTISSEKLANSLGILKDLVNWTLAVKTLKRLRSYSKLSFF